MADFGATSNVTVSLRVPYDVKDQKVRYTTLSGEPFVPPYGDIHHRSETLRGVSDGQLTALFPLGNALQVGAGLSLPLGRTEENPIELGREGKKHEHIQFGSGTVDPVVSAVWSHPIGPVVLAASADAQLPLYRNSKGFKAPATIRYSVGPSLPLGTTGLAFAVCRAVPGDRALERRGRRRDGVPQRRRLPARDLSSVEGIPDLPGGLSRDLLEEPFRRILPSGHDLVPDSDPLLLIAALHSPP